MRHKKGILDFNQYLQGGMPWCPELRRIPYKSQERIELSCAVWKTAILPLNYWDKKTLTQNCTEILSLEMRYVTITLLGHKRFMSGMHRLILITKQVHHFNAYEP
jgi:hypothetical protein